MSKNYPNMTWADHFAERARHEGEDSHIYYVPDADDFLDHDRKSLDYDEDGDDGEALEAAHPA